jgi:hypothetical protein
MNLHEATTLVSATLEKMRYGDGTPIFDEWFILSVAGARVDIVHYSGLRGAEIPRELRRTIEPLAEELAREDYQPGHFYFSREGDGALCDAFMTAGPRTHVVFNSVEKSMDEITADPIWADVQVHFVELSECLRANPLR